MPNLESHNFNQGRETLPKNKEAKSSPKGRLREEDFIDHPYKQHDVEADIVYVQRRKAEYEGKETLAVQEQKEAADIFEKEILQNIRELSWMGPNATAIQTTEFDDLHNGVDMIVEFKDAKSPAHLGLAADVTFSSDRSVIAKKFEVIRDQIWRGTLAQIKYYRSASTGYQGPLHKLPEVVIGVSKALVLELARLRAEGDKRALATHRASILILLQAEKQLEVFAKHARSVNQPSAALIYTERLILIREILSTKKELVEEVKKRAHEDPVHAEIMQFMEKWSRY